VIDDAELRKRTRLSNPERLAEEREALRALDDDGDCCCEPAVGRLGSPYRVERLIRRECPIHGEGAT
jgi:hypothetical protein